LGLEDKTLAEIVISMAKSEWEAYLEREGATRHSVDPALVQKFQQKLSENGAANAPLRLVSHTLQLVLDMSPRLARRQLARDEKKRKRKLQRDVRLRTRLGGKHDGVTSC
jgi:hypothetical protein